MKVVKKICAFAGIDFLMWIYSEALYGIEDDYVELMRSWMRGFHNIDAAYIHWIALRICIWLCVLWNMLQLEKSFCLYLFIREHNFKRIFMKQYIKCVCETILYFMLQAFVFAVLLYIWGEKQGIRISFENREMGMIILKECIAALNFCLLVYGLYCCLKKIEISFIFIFLFELIIRVIPGNGEINLMPELLLNIGLVIAVMNYSSAGFYERIQGEK